MILYRNYTGRTFKDEQAEINAIKTMSGQTTRDGDMFELLEVVLNKSTHNVVKTAGFQDTDIVHDQDGNLTISHRPAGMGSLKFKPTLYGNPTAYLAKTEHNMEMLARHFRNRNWKITDKETDNEVKELSKAIWESLSEKDKKEALGRERMSKMDVFDLPSEAPKVESNSGNNMIQLLAEKEAELDRLRAELSERMPPAKVDGDKTPAEVVPVPAPEPVEKDIFLNMELFKVRILAKKYGVPYKLETKKVELVPLVKAAMEKQKQEELA